MEKGNEGGKEVEEEEENKLNGCHDKKKGAAPMCLTRMV